MGGRLEKYDFSSRIEIDFEVPIEIRFSMCLVVVLHVFGYLQGCIQTDLVNVSGRDGRWNL